MKKLFSTNTSIFIIFLSLSSQFFAKDNVDIIVIGSGKTIEDAKNNALRSAVEQVTGVYITSQTNILNGKIVNDKITGITNGSIIKYDIINKAFVSDLYVLTIKATISPQVILNYINQNTTLGEAIDPELYLSNMKQKELDSKAEELAIRNLEKIWENEIRKCYNYQLKLGEPITSSGAVMKLVTLEVTITITPNKNLKKLNNFLISNLEKISIPKNEIDEYCRLTGDYVSVWYKSSPGYPNFKKECETDQIKHMTNNPLACLFLRNQMWLDKSEIFNFKINDGNCDWIAAHINEFKGDEWQWYSTIELISMNSSEKKIQREKQFVIGNIRSSDKEGRCLATNSTNCLVNIIDNKEATYIVKMTGFKYFIDDFKNISNFTVIPK